MNSWTHAVGYTALIVLLSAGAAQGLSGVNTVFTDDIVDGTIRHQDVKPNSLGGSRLLDNAVTGGKVLNGSITGADLASGSVGLSQLGGTWTSPVREQLFGNVSGYAWAPCPAGQTAISGAASSPSSASAMMSSIPLNDGWFTSFRNWHAANTIIEVQALCIPK